MQPLTEPESKLDLTQLLKGSADEGQSGSDLDVFIDPIDGRLVDPEDVDSLIDAYEQAKEANDILYAWQQKLRKAIGEKATGEQKSQQVRGNRRIAKVTKPSESWDQSILKEVYNSYPKLRNELLRVSTIGVKAREFKTAIKTNGPDDYNNFVKMVQSAKREPAGLPTIKIEENVKE